MRYLGKNKGISTRHNPSVRIKDSTAGITLIALVITIIVLLILAGVAISMLSGENGILNQAAKAKTETEKAQTTEAVKLASMSALTSGNGSINYNILNTELEEAGYDVKTNGKIKKLPKMIEIDGQHYAISEKGKVTVAKWYYKKDEEGRKTIITNGEIELPIGTYVNYNPQAKNLEGTETIEKTYTSPTGTYIEKTMESASKYKVERGSGYSVEQTFSNTTETNGWRVLGVDEGTGEIQLISADTIKTTENTSYYLRGFTGYQYGIQELNNISEIFGYGYGATGARSITVDDVNRITGYNPKNIGVYDPEQTGSGTRNDAGNINQYDNRVTYSWTSKAGYISYSSTNLITGTMDISTTYGFNWYDKETKVWKTVMQDINNPAEIVTLTNTVYGYNPVSITGNGLDNTNTLTGPYAALFCDSTGTKKTYWLDYSYIYTHSNTAIYGLNWIGTSGNIGSPKLYWSYGTLETNSNNISPVVSLKYDIELTDSNSDGIYEIVK